MRAKFSIGSSEHGSRREESSSRVGWATGGKIRWTIKGFAFSIHTHFFMQVHSCDTGKSKNGQKWFNLFRAQWEGKFISRLLQNFLRLSRRCWKKAINDTCCFSCWEFHFCQNGFWEHCRNKFESRNFCCWNARDQTFQPPRTPNSFQDWWKSFYLHILKPFFLHCFL